MSSSKVVPTTVEMSTRYVSECGTDIGPKCRACQGQIWYYVPRVTETRAFEVNAKCVGCHARETFPATNIESARAVREAHEHARMCTPMPRTARFQDGTEVPCAWTDEVLARMHGWSMTRDSLRGETVFSAWVLEPIECSDGEYVRVKQTVAIASDTTITFYTR